MKHNPRKYDNFLSGKLKTALPSLSLPYLNKNEMLKPFQVDIVEWALKRGRAAIFADCGLGKGPMQLTWANNIPGKVLILAPLAVSKQMLREAKKFGIEVSYAKTQEEVTGKITVTNYERLDSFDLSEFTGISCDEASILKSLDGKTKSKLIDQAQKVRYRLSCTATPAPNDYMELGNQAEFLGVTTHKEMLATYFVHDGGDTAKWRLKGHAKTKFWEWLASWSIMVAKPSDLGHSDEGYILPKLNMIPVFVKSDVENIGLFPEAKLSLRDRQQLRKGSISERVKKCAEIIGDSKEQWIVWCGLNDESGELAMEIPQAEEVTGSMDSELKEEKLMAFVDGKLRTLVSKTKICGFGLNFQNCHNLIYCGISDSYESFYQSVRRVYRFGQTEEVNCYIIISEAEEAVLKNIERKEREMKEMQENLVGHVAKINLSEIQGATWNTTEYRRDVAHGGSFTLHLGDCMDVLKEMEPESVGYTIFSPPFASLYTYSNSERDMGNVRNYAEFFEHFEFLIPELLRVTQPGRLLSFHCMNYPTSKSNDGYIGMRDFRGELIHAFVNAGWIFHSEVCIWKDPVTQMQRTKALGLLHKQIKKDSAMSRQGIADYIVTMRKPGENPKPISHTAETFPVGIWQNYASPVWMDINPSDTLQYMAARDSSDERHICPLQLSPIRRCLGLWSEVGDTVFSPFAGIGSEGFCAVEMGRKFIGAELKESYWNQAVKNLRVAEAKKCEMSLFELA